MSEEATVVESAAAPEVQQRAEQMGWIPPTRFKGDPERFVDAQEFIERGEVVLPIVKQRLRETEAKLADTNARAAKVEAALARANEAIENIELKFSVEKQREVERAREDLKRQLTSASQADDHEAVAELTDQLTRVNSQIAEGEKVVEKKEVVETQRPTQLPPDLIEWNNENPWFGKDKRKTALALAIGEELRDSGETATGRAFFDKINAELAKDPHFKEEPRVDKVSGGRHSDEGGSRSGGGKNYNHLPAEAKTACDADARRFVGPEKKFKNIAEWRSNYAQLYFQQ